MVIEVLFFLLPEKIDCKINQCVACQARQFLTAFVYVSYKKKVEVAPENYYSYINTYVARRKIKVRVSSSK